jgi:hypothetical protein
MKKLFAVLLFIIVCISVSIAQNTTTVSAKGVGLNRSEALTDAFRNAVGQGVGVVVSSQSIVENLVLIKDAISTRTDGVIVSHKVTSEAPLKDSYEINIEAVVSLDPIKQSVTALQQMVGGIRFLVLYNDKDITSGTGLYDYGVERMNENLKTKGYRYVEKSRFDKLKTEAVKIMKNDTSQVDYVQKLGMFSDAQFIIQISNIKTRVESKADGIKAVKVTLEAKAYDNCVAEGLGTITLESSWLTSKDVDDATRLGIAQAIDSGSKKLLELFNKSMADWVNNGAPYELRFYDVGRPRDLRGLIAKLQDDPNFGGTLEPVQTGNFVKINCTYRKKPYDMYNTVLDYADAIPELKAKVIDAKMQYGRQISFAPDGTVVPDVDAVKKLNDTK